jgi:hypothetical protein
MLRGRGTRRFCQAPRKVAGALEVAACNSLVFPGGPMTIERAEIGVKAMPDFRFLPSSIISNTYPDGVGVVTRKEVTQICQLIDFGAVCRAQHLMETQGQSTRCEQQGPPGGGEPPRPGPEGGPAFLSQCRAASTQFRRSALNSARQPWQLS